MEMNPGLVNLALSAEGIYKTSSIIYIRFNILCMDIFVYVFPSHGNLLCWVMLRHRPTGCVVLFRHVNWVERWWWWGRQHEPGPLGNTTALMSLKKKKRKKENWMQLWVTDRMNNWWCRQRLVKSRKLIRYTGPLRLNKLGRGQSLAAESHLLIMLREAPVFFHMVSLTAGDCVPTRGSRG